MKSDLVSIIIPIYNVATFLPKTIESIQAQTYKNFELILVDDGSPDKSGEICDKYAANDSRIRVFHNSNAGAGAARMYGARQAKGKWITFVDGDDTIPASAISDLVACNTDDYDITIGTINLNNKRQFNHKCCGVLTRDEYIIALLLRTTSIGPVAKLFKKELFDIEFFCPKHITNNEDLFMLIAISTNIDKVFISNDIISYNYLYREGSASKVKGMKLENWLYLFDKINGLLNSIQTSPEVKRAFISYRLRLLNIVATKYGYKVNPSESRIKELLLETKGCKLNSQEAKTVKILQSIPRQRIIYFYNSFISVIRSIVKKFINKK